MEPIVIATWGLVVATLGLVVVTWLQGQRQDLAGSNNSVPIALTLAEGPSYPTNGDLLVARVTGRPANGEEQSSEFLYRILPDRTAEDLSVIQPLAEWGSPEPRSARTS